MSPEERGICLEMIGSLQSAIERTGRDSQAAVAKTVIDLNDMPPLRRLKALPVSLQIGFLCFVAIWAVGTTAALLGTQ